MLLDWMDQILIHILYKKSFRGVHDVMSQKLQYQGRPLFKFVIN